ncbi:MAG TPA: DUF2071 domain-containing protein, partial [Gemmatimonadaceae bacterium]
EVLGPLVPRGTRLDLWEGRALVSVVGFRFIDTRVIGVPIPFHRNFDEVNLRFYVRRELPGGEARRGVVFIRELVPKPMIAWVARALYNEPYRALPMRSEAPHAPTEAPGPIRYAWRRRTAAGPAWEHVSARAVGDATVPAAGTEVQFITEHYWGYTRQRDGSTIEYEVRHPSWRVWAGEGAELHADVATLYGPELVDSLAGRPRSAFIAEGSPVSVHWPTHLR